MENSFISSYIIMWMHLINMTIRLFYESNLNNFEIIRLNMDKLNLFLSNLLSVNLVFDDGVIDIITLITAVNSFYLGKYYCNSLIMLIISTIIFEILIIYNFKNGRLLNSVLVIICFYLFGILFRKNKNTYILEKSLKNENIYDEINIQEYEPYKLY